LRIGVVVVVLGLAALELHAASSPRAEKCRPLAA